MKAEDNRFPHVTYIPGATPDVAPDTGDQRTFFDADGVFSDIDTDGDIRPHAPILLIETGGTVPAGTAPGTLIIEKAP